MKNEYSIHRERFLSRNRWFRIALALVFACGGIVPASVAAQPVIVPSVVSHVSPLTRLFGLRIHPDDSLQLDFLLDESPGTSSESSRTNVQRMVNDFLTVLAVPEDQIWVNLSPQEPDRIIPDVLRRTEMGQVLLQQDEALKELTASVLGPEHAVGKVFWQKLSEINRNSPSEDAAALMHKVWIVPDYASVAVKGDQVFITDYRLKILNEDETGNNDVQRLVQEIVIPALEDLVNRSETFEPLRQVYRSMILAAWYKKNLKNSFLNAAYKNQMKMGGLDGEDAARVQRIYGQYLQNFESGAYNVIQEDYDPLSNQVVARNYISGGIDAASLTKAVHEEGDDAMLENMLARLQAPKSYPVHLNIMGAGKNLNQAMLVQPEKNLMVAPSLMDIAAYLWEDGTLDYKDGFEKAKALIKQLADSGVGNIYLYGGLYEVGGISIKLHQVEPGEQLVVSDDGKCFVLVPNYITKRQPRSSEDSTELRDHFGNNFSIYDLQRFNPKMTSRGKSARDEFKELVAYAKSLGVEITVDMIPWLAPDAINATNLHWTNHRALSAPELLQVQRGGEAIKELLRENGGSFLREIDGTYYLIQHLDGGYGPNLDQVYPNAFLPEVQKYYIDAVKNVIDLGVTSVRVDLAHKLLGSKLGEAFKTPPDILQDSIHHEPWFEIMKGVQGYIRDKNVNFTWIMETYDDGDKIWMNAIAREAQARARFYHKKIVDTYHALKEDGTAWGVAYELGRAIHAALNESDPDLFSMIAFLANFDEKALKHIGGSVESMVKMLILLSHLGVPVMIDLREWMLHSGHVIPIVGGETNPVTGVSSHPFVQEDEWLARMAEDGLKKIMDSLPWKGFVEKIQDMNKNGFDFIVQQHEDGYPGYFFDYTDHKSRNDFLTIGWRTGEDLNLFVVNIGKNPDITSVDIVIPEEFQELYKGKFIRVDMAPGRTDQLATVKPGGAFVDHDAAMMTQAPGGIRLDARDLDMRQNGSWEHEWTLPAYLEKINPNDIQGMVPVVSGSTNWNRPQFTQ